MNSKWLVNTLRDVGVRTYDCAHWTPKAQKVGYNYIAITDLQNGNINYHTSRLISKTDYEKSIRSVKPKIWDIIIPRRARVGDTYLVQSEIEFALGQNLIIIRSEGTKAYTKYLYYALKSPFYWNQVFKFLNVGAIFDSLNVRDFEKFTVPFPNLIHQKCIGELLFMIDQKIQLNHQMNDTLEQMAQAIFKSWFVDFEPFRDPEHEWYTEFEYNEELEKEIPKRWEVTSIDDFATLIMGQSPPGISYNDDQEGIVFFQGNKDFGFRYPSPRIWTNDPKRIAEKNDIIVSVRAPVGDLNLAPTKCCIGRGIAAIRPKNNGRAFIYYFTMTLKEKWDSYAAQGTIFSSLRKTDLQSIRFIDPPMILLNKFQQLVGPIDNKIENNSQQIGTLSELRDLLLPQLISGKLRIPNPEKFLEELENTSGVSL